jgi:protoheme IX farnesyltransferase
MFVWQLPHFMAISIFHAKDYARAGIKVYPNEKGEERTKKNILLGTLWLFAVSLTPSYWGDIGQAYQLAALILGGAFTLLAFAGFFLPKSDVLGLRLWARRYFLGSLFYLPLLMGSMIFFR